MFSLINFLPLFCNINQHLMGCFRCFSLFRWEKLCLINFIFFPIFIIGICVWSGIFFGIYLPLLKRDYKEGICTINEADLFSFNDTIYYYSYSVSVNISNILYPAYGCSTTYAEYSISNGWAAGSYPYQYADCSADLVVAHNKPCFHDQLFQPLWTCRDASAVYFKLATVPCKWWLANDAGSETEPSKIKNLKYPSYGKAWIEVIFTDKVYIPKIDYMVLWIAPFWMLTCGSFVTLAWYNCGIYFVGYRHEFIRDIVYYYMKYIRRNKHIRKIYRPPHIGVVENDREVSTNIFLMSILHSKKMSKFPKVLIRKTVKYF
ncbi:unnamed protein product [Blepharisma stoltei]|uniref:Uncharacterized protein n=1 Tax=Blepharisma stoltei TaxID=1481888 RepID=A0AAU9K8B4_9CILI|nr:unnamed protein product [Blepharisma stoltei]